MSAQLPRLHSLTIPLRNYPTLAATGEAINYDQSPTPRRSTLLSIFVYFTFDIQTIEQGEVPSVPVLRAVHIFTYPPQYPRHQATPTLLAGLAAPVPETRLGFELQDAGGNFQTFQASRRPKTAEEGNHDRRKLEGLVPFE